MSFVKNNTFIIGISGTYQADYTVTALAISGPVSVALTQNSNFVLGSAFYLPSVSGTVEVEGGVSLNALSGDKVQLINNTTNDLYLTKAGPVITNSNVATDQNVSSIEVTNTIPPGANSYVAVQFTRSATLPINIIDVTDNLGNNYTSYVSNESTPSLAFWYASNPKPGDATITVTFKTIVDYVIVEAISIQGVSPSSAVSDYSTINTTIDSSGPFSNTILVPGNPTLGLSIIGTQAGSLITGVSGAILVQGATIPLVSSQEQLTGAVFQQILPSLPFNINSTITPINTSTGVTGIGIGIPSDTGQLYVFLNSPNCASLRLNLI